jgi:hypothetical protein
VLKLPGVLPVIDILPLPVAVMLPTNKDTPQELDPELQAVPIIEIEPFSTDTLEEALTWIAQPEPVKSPLIPVIEMQPAPYVFILVPPMTTPAVLVPPAPRPSITIFPLVLFTLNCVLRHPLNKTPTVENPC